MGAALVLSTGPALMVGRSGPKLAQELAVGWFIVVVLTFGKSGTLALQLWRFRYVVPRFSIIALRPFHNRDTSYLYRRLVAPVLGCYGVVSVVSDDTFAAGARKVDDGTFEVEVIGDPQMATTYSDDEWRRSVMAEIAIADFAVLDLTLPSENLLWEIANCVYFLPPHRVFIIGVRGLADWDARLALVRDHLDKALPDSAAPYQLQPPIEYGGRLFGTWRFRISIFREVRKLRRLDQAVSVAGTWHPPIIQARAAEPKVK